MANVIDSVVRSLSRLSASHRTLFFAYCAERLLPLYRDFAEQEGWGDYRGLRETLTLCWSCLEGDDGARRGLAGAVERVDLLAPHADDFEAVATIFAQDACGCLRATVQGCIGIDPDPNEVTCVFEAIRVGITFARTGFLDLGSGEEADSLERVIETHPRVLSECETELALIETLQGNATVIPDLVRDTLRQAMASAWRLESILSK